MRKFLIVLCCVLLLCAARGSAVAADIAAAPAVSVDASAVAAPAAPAEASAPDIAAAPAPAEGQSAPAEAVQVTQYLDEMLDSANTRENPVGELLRKLPRYGMSFFRQPASTYTPISSVPVTSGYTLGPDDNILITLWGMVEDSFEVTINRDGMANVPHIGATRLAGYTLEEAKSILKARFDRYFTGYEMNVSMGKLRSITVYVTGDVKSPGAYTISSFSTLVNALLASGGPSNSGTLRRIELKRGGKTITTFDMYDLLLRGDKAKDVRLQDADVIFVPPVGSLVGLAGEIRRPGVYELNGRTLVRDILYLAGGISAQTFKGRIQYYRIENQHYRSVFEGDVDGLSQTPVTDGDVLRLYPVVDIPTTVRINGPVARPGTYGVVPGVTKISELMAQAGGLLVTASGRGELTRVEPSAEGPVTTRFQIDLFSAAKGEPVNDLVLQLNDYLLVHIIPEWETQRVIKVSGEVLHPGDYAIAKGERLSELIARCGGFTSRASLRGAVFTRRSVAAEQRRELSRVADQMERDLLQMESGLGEGRAISAEEHKRNLTLIENLRRVELPGRVVMKLDVPEAIKGTPWDVELENGDALFIPETPSTIEVLGAVYAASSHVYSPRMGINDYVNASGGYLRSAHKRMLYLLKKDG
ncbi:MAG: SLBB domain-containing protein, partial [Synergistaceae bacterium]|nr:SLBB domain-containing protein [Synergistaceae bacterium]